MMPIATNETEANISLCIQDIFFYKTKIIIMYGENILCVLGVVFFFLFCSSSIVVGIFLSLRARLKNQDTRLMDRALLPKESVWCVNLKSAYKLM